MCQNFEKICTTSLPNKGENHIFGSVSDPRAHYHMTHKQYKYYSTLDLGHPYLNQFNLCVLYVTFQIRLHVTYPIIIVDDKNTDNFYLFLTYLWSTQKLQSR